MEGPPSPCDSCSSAYAKCIPTAKRSPARVPITPTSPTADAEDADTEKTDVERNRRVHGRNCNSALPKLRIIIPPRPSAPHNAKTPSFVETEAKLRDGKECTRRPRPNLAAPPLDQGARPSTNNEHGPSNPNLNQSPYTYPTTPSSPDRAFGLFWPSREAPTTTTTNINGTTANTVASADHDDDDDDDDDGNAHTISSDDDDGLVIHVKGTMGNSRTEGTLGLAVTGPGKAPARRKRPGSPYPFRVGASPWRGGFAA